MTSTDPPAAAPPPRSPASRWKRIAAKVGLVAASTLVSLLLAECGFRVFADKPVLRAGWHLGKGWRILDAAAIVLRPELATPDHYSHRAGVPSIVFLGDSFTEGFPFTNPSDRSFVGLVRAGLREAHLDVDVINAGQGESGTDQQIRIFEAHVLPNLKPSIVVWQLYTNDVHENSDYAAFEISPDGTGLLPLDGRDHWLHTRQAIWDRAPLPDRVKRWSYLFTSILRATESQPAVPARFNGDRERWELEKIRLGIARMQAHAQHHGFVLVPFVIAPGAVFLARTDPSWAQNYVYRIYREQRALVAAVPGVLDTEFTADEIAGATQRFGVTSIFMGDDDPAELGNKHYNEAGHWLLAQRLLPALSARLRSVDGALAPR